MYVFNSTTYMELLWMSNQIHASLVNNLIFFTFISFPAILLVKDFVHSSINEKKKKKKKRKKNVPAEKVH